MNVSFWYIHSWSQWLEIIILFKNHEAFFLYIPVKSNHLSLAFTIILMTKNTWYTFWIICISQIWDEKKPLISKFWTIFRISGHSVMYVIRGFTLVLDGQLVKSSRFNFNKWPSLVEKVLKSDADYWELSQTCSKLC